MKQLKITKLFHWLYALLMLAPCFAILFKCLYVVCNKNAYENYSERVNIYAESNLVETSSDIEVNHVYKYLGTYNFQSSSSQELMLILPLNYSSFDYHDISYGRFYISSDNLVRLFIQLYSGNYYIRDVTSSNFDFVVLDKLDNFEFINNFIDCFTFSQFDYVLYDTPGYLDNVFYYSMEQVATSDIFGWARYSFIAQPFSYITGLFGMSADNPLNIYFSYWASISIIWLVFDIVLYVPLLAHKWLDEGGI